MCKFGEKKRWIVKNGRKIKRKIFTGLALLALLIGMLVFLFSGDNFIILQDLFKDDVTKEELREALGKLGFKGYFTIGILSMLQVVLTFLPAEPVQVMAGLSFGFLKGSLICLAGVFVGNTIIYILYKIYGNKLEEYFTKNAEFDFETASRSPKIALVVFILYFLPAIPYGLICFFTASMGNKYPKYILLTTLGSIPSIWIGVGLGHLAIASSWIVSLIVFLVLIALLVILYKKKSFVFAKVNEFMKKKSQPYSSKTVAKDYNPVLYRLAAFFGGLAYSMKLKIRMKNSVGRLEKPSIVICNHGSFIDFVYAAQLLKKDKPHFITARMYFYHKWLGGLLRRVGCIPKSMFTADLENAKNCMRILNEGRVLAMMPEARLSTAGRYEGVQETTYRFIKRAGVSVYTIHMSGDYLANPKWGDKTRRGAYVEAELKGLFTAEELSSLSMEEVKRRVDEALYYDEFKWLEAHPEVVYKHKPLAVGLENILCRCPGCNGKYTLRTKGREIACEKCGFKRELDTRYAFTEPVPFENFGKWYDWQTAEMEKELLADPEYALEEAVTLKHSSKDGKTTFREAGKGVCRLDKTGLIYRGTRDGEEIEKRFPLSDIYRLLFGAGVDFEIYEGNELWFFVPEDTRSCVAWYIASGLFKKHYGGE